MFGRRREVPPPPFRAGGPVRPNRPEQPGPKPIPPLKRWMVHYIGDDVPTVVDGHRMEFRDGVAIFSTFTESTWQWYDGILGPFGWMHHYRRIEIYVSGFRTIVPTGVDHKESCDDNE